MALAGHDTPILVLDNAATASSYSGTLAGVAAGELIVACITACADGVGTDPSGWTVTLGSDTLTFRAGPAPTTSHGTAAIFTGVASASGAQTLAVSPGVNLRACTAHAFRITGFDATTPIPNSNPASSYSSDASALTGPNGVTTAANGNAIIGCIGIPGGDTTALAVGAADGSTVGQSGPNAFNDHEWGVAWQRTPTAASVTFGWTWSSNPARPGLAWVEVAEAAGGGGQTITGASFSDADTFDSGTVFAIYGVSGAPFSDADAFHGGIVSQGLVIAGAPFAEADAFHGGAFSTAYAITGAAFTDADTFHGGVIGQGLIIVGEHFPAATWGGSGATWGGLPADWGGDLFHGGTISATYAIAGASFDEPDAFHGGVIGQGLIIVGALFDEADVFHGGVLSTAYAIAGAAFIEADAFHGGSIGQGAFIAGAAFVDADTFPAGSVSNTATIGGAAFLDADTFHGGVTVTVYGIAGAVFIDADTFHGGSIGEPPAVNHITLAANTPPSFLAVGGQGAIRAIGGGR